MVTGYPAFGGNDVHQALKGEKVACARWEYVERAGEIIAEILQAMGIPLVR